MNPGRAWLGVPRLHLSNAFLYDWEVWSEYEDVVGSIYELFFLILATVPLKLLRSEELTIEVNFINCFCL